MIPDVTEVTLSGGTNILLKFDDGASGEVDVAQMVSFDGVFAPLRDPAYFAKVAVIPELGTIGWPNGADLDPVVLREKIAPARTER